jgi:ribonuclease M5
MSERIKLNQIVLVEGKYDVIRLQSMFDAVIIPTHGFQIYKSRETQAMIRRLAEHSGVIILTDSDAAGMQIRAFLKSILPPDCVRHVYIPQITGKERRKRVPSKAGILGAEGLTTEELRRAFERAGISFANNGASFSKSDCVITKLDLFRDGFVGKSGSKARMRELLFRLRLPQNLSSNALAALLETAVSAEEYRAAVRAIEGENT